MLASTVMLKKVLGLLLFNYVFSMNESVIENAAMLLKPKIDWRFKARLPEQIETKEISIAIRYRWCPKSKLGASLAAYKQLQAINKKAWQTKQTQAAIKFPASNSELEQKESRDNFPLPNERYDFNALTRKLNDSSVFSDFEVFSYGYLDSMHLLCLAINKFAICFGFQEELVEYFLKFSQDLSEYYWDKECLNKQRLSASHSLGIFDEMDDQICDYMKDDIQECTKDNFSHAKFDKKTEDVVIKQSRENDLAILELCSQKLAYCRELFINRKKLEQSYLLQGESIWIIDEIKKQNESFGEIIYAIFQIINSIEP